MQIRLTPEMTPAEQSITLYHEVFEATLLQAGFRESIPAGLEKLAEADVDLLARVAHESLGPVSPTTLSDMLSQLGFKL